MKHKSEWQQEEKIAAVEEDVIKRFQEAAAYSQLEEEYELTKRRIENWNKKKKSVWVYLLFMLTGMLVSGVYLWSSYETSLANRIPNSDLIISAAMFIFVTLVFVIYWNMILESKINTYKNKLVRYEVYDISKNIEEDIYENSIKMSYKYLDEYYMQTRTQAQNGFYITIGVAIGGAIFIGIGIITMFDGATSPSYVTTASGVIIEFVSAIFFYLYNRTIQSMNTYHDKLVLSHNVSIALKVAESLSDREKDNTKIEIVRELIKDINIHIKHQK